MGKRGGTVEYLYWSARRTGRFIEDNNLAAPQVSRTISSPPLGWLPTLSRTATITGSLRPQIARTIEKALGQIAVTRFDVPGPIQYAKGTSTVVFGEFRTFQVRPERQPALMFTAVDYDKSDRGSVAICLYGSMDNFPEYVQSAGPGFRDGWVSSSAPEVYNFIKSHGQQFDDPLEAEEMAFVALGISDGQGLSGVFTGEDRLGLNRPWQRGFTYGDVPNAQWLARIYLDVDLLPTENGRMDGFRRVLIGAPLWIRTSEPQAVRLYASTDNPDVVEARRVRAKRRGARAGKAAPRPLADREVDAPEIILDELPEEEAGEQDGEGQTIAIPYRVYRMLKTGFAMGEADWVIRDVEDAPADDRVPHLGDPFGLVFAWVWDHNKDEAIMLLSDYLSELRRRHHLLPDKIDSPIRLDEVLSGLEPALPSRFTDYDEVVTKARREVRRYYGADPNA